MTEHTPETLEDALALIQALQKKTGELENESTKLKATKEGLLKDLRKKKTIDSFLKVAGIELTDDLDEEEIADRIASCPFAVPLPLHRSKKGNVNRVPCPSPPFEEWNCRSRPRLVARKHVEEKTENLLNLIPSYNRFNHFYEKKVVGIGSDAWSLASSRNSSERQYSNVTADQSQVEEVNTDVATESLEGNNTSYTR